MAIGLSPMFPSVSLNYGAMSTMVSASIILIIVGDICQRTSEVVMIQTIHIEDIERRAAQYRDNFRLATHEGCRLWQAD